MTNSLIDNISRYIKLSPDEHAVFESFWKEKTLGKGEFILRNGEVCRYDSYVISGALKAYFIDATSGKEEILYFAVDEWWATDIDSFSGQKPSIYNIQTITETTILQISHHAFEQLLFQIPSLERYFRIILERYLATLQKRIIYINVYDAEYRYADFLNTYPLITSKVPLYLIASYLGISAEFLSRIRKKRKQS